MIRDLALIVAAAAVVNLLFHRLRLPAVLGYLLAGLLLSPFLAHLPVFHGTDGIEQLNALGLLFVMFTLGLGFDVARLRRVFWPALLAAALQTAVIFFLGVVCAPLLGFGQREGVVLGAVLTSSGAILCVHLLRVRGRLQLTDANLAIGILLFESVAAVVFLVALSAYAHTGSLSAEAILRTLFFIAVVIVGVYLLGRIVAPAVAKFLRKSRSPELLTLVVIAVVLGAGEVAKASYASQALGAFVAGAVLARTVLQREIQRVTEPFRDLFCALFFVSVAMLADTGWMLGYWAEILLIALLVVTTKALMSWLGLFVGGQPPEIALRASLVKASVGEFGFVIAGLGYKLGVVSAKMLSLTVGLAVISAVAVIAVNWRPERVHAYLAQKTPDPLARAARIYGRMLDAMGRYIGRRTFLALARAHLLKVLIYGLLLTGIIVGGYLGSLWLQQRTDSYREIGVIVLWLAVAAAGVPGVTAIVRSLDSLVAIIAEATLSYGSERQMLGKRMRTLFHALLMCLGMLLFGGFYLAAASPFFPTGVTLLIFIALFALACLIFWRSVSALNGRMEYLFFQSFQAHGREDDRAAREGLFKELAHTYPWEAGVCELVIDARSVACGRKIADLRIRKQTGAQVIAVCRGGLTHFSPSPEIPLFPQDTVVLFGTPAQNEAAVRMLSLAGPGGGAGEGGSFGLEKVFVGGFSPLVGHTLAEAEVLGKYRVSVLGIQRGHERLLAVGGEELIHSGDLLLVSGRTADIAAFAAVCASEAFDGEPVWLPEFEESAAAAATPDSAAATPDSAAHADLAAAGSDDNADNGGGHTPGSSGASDGKAGTPR